MKPLLAGLCLWTVCLAASAVRAQQPAPQKHKDALAALGAALVNGPQAIPSGPAMTLHQVEAIAMEANPAISVAVRRVAMTESGIPAAGALDDPTLMYRGWGVPLNEPWNYNKAQNMFMFTQSLPGIGKRNLRTGIAQINVTQAKDELAATRLQVRVQVRKAFFDLLLAQDELRIHQQNVAIARQAIAAAQIRYSVGTVPQQDVLKAQVALTQLDENLIRFEQDADVARARLNALMSRSPGGPLRVTGDYQINRSLPSAESLEQTALQQRPDLLDAEAGIAKSRKQQQLAKKSYVPNVTLSGGYMLMPPTSSIRNTYMVQAGINLPWLNHRKHNAQIATARARVSEQEAELSDLRNAAFDQIQESLAETLAAQRLARVYQASLQPQAEATLHAAVIAYENNQTDFLNLLDSQQAVIRIDLAWLQALRQFNSRLADLELAVGAPIPLQQSSTSEVKP